MTDHGQPMSFPILPVKILAFCVIISSGTEPATHQLALGNHTANTYRVMPEGPADQSCPNSPYPRVPSAPANLDRALSRRTTSKMGASGDVSPCRGRTLSARHHTANGSKKVSFRGSRRGVCPDMTAPVSRSTSQREGVRPPVRRASVPAWAARQGPGPVQGQTKRKSKTGAALTKDARVHVLMLGAAGVGKSSLVSQFHASNIDSVRVAISNVYGENRDGTEDAQLTIVDNPANEVSPEMAIECCDVDAYVVVYAVTDRESFRVAQTILRTLSLERPLNKTAVVLAGNKVDLVRSRAITTDEGKCCAAGLGCKFVETSDWIDYNVDILFDTVLSQIKRKRVGSVTDTPIGPLTNEASTSCAAAVARSGKKRNYRRSKTLGAKSWAVLKDLINIFNRKVKSCNDLQDL